MKVLLPLLAAAVLAASGCAPAVRAVTGTAGIAGRTVGVASRTAMSAVPLAASLIPTKILFSCIPEGTLIDTPAGPRAIESIRPGDEVVGFENAPVRVLQKHSYAEDSAGTRFIRLKFESGRRVQLCDLHRIDGIRAKDLEPGDSIGGQIVQSSQHFGGVERSYDLLTEDAGYRISGLPVNSMIEEMIAASRDGLDSVRGD